MLRTLAEKKALDDGIRKAFDAGLREFRDVFQLEGGVALAQAAAPGAKE